MLRVLLASLRVGIFQRIGRPLGQAGAAAILLAVTAPVLVMIVGFAADYGYASYINQRLARATDAATLGSVSQTAATSAGGYTNLAGLQTIGVNYFNANVAQLPVTNVSFNLSVVSDGSGGVIATGTYAYNNPTFFAGILGFDNIPLSGVAKTTARPLVYVNYYILVDTSQSMGIAATQADMDLLYQRVATNRNATTYEAGCVFGCHVRGTRYNGQPGTQPYTNEDLAHNTTRLWSPMPGTKVNLRIDAAVSAIQSIINTASTVAGATLNIQFALYTIQLDPTNNNQLSTIATMSSNYSSLQSAAATIELGNNVAGGTGDTDFPNELTTFNNMLTRAGVTRNGSGASATSPLNFVFIVSDGLYDVGSGHSMGAFSGSNCDALKQKATVGTIYTIFSPIWQNNVPGGQLNPDYVRLVQPYTQPTDQLASGLLRCATSSNYAFTANDGPDIIAAMQTLFQNTQPSSARIVQ